MTPEHALEALRKLADDCTNSQGEVDVIDLMAAFEDRYGTDWPWLEDLATQVKEEVVYSQKCPSKTTM